MAIKGELTFLLPEEWVSFSETYTFSCSDEEEALKHLRKIAEARAKLTAENVLIVRLKVGERKQEGVCIFGSGGEFATSRFSMVLSRDSNVSRRRLRGVPFFVSQLGNIGPISGCQPGQFERRR